MMNKKKIKILRKKIVADTITPVAVFNSVKENDYVYLLESVEKGKTGRYTFIGLPPKWVYKMLKGKIHVYKRTQEGYEKEEEIKTDDPLSVIQDILNDYKIEHSSEMPPFTGGIVGYLGYEIISTWENIKFSNTQDPDFPMGVMMFTDELIAFDHLYNTAEVVKISIDDINEDNKRIEDIIDLIQNSSCKIEPLSLESKKDIDIKSNFDIEEFKDKVKSIKEEIFAGEIIQAVFSQRLSVDSDADPFNFYRALRIINPSPYMFYLKLDDIILCGSSPEVMVKVIGKTAIIRPIAGTRKRGSTAEEESRLAKELQSDIKEKAEHIMLVDLARNDLGKVCEFGSIRVHNLMDIEKFSHVMHMVTDVTGELKEGVSNVDVFKAGFPAGTVSGAPKIRAIEIVEEQENVMRGPYAGAVGYFSFTGDMDTCIIIRTIVVHEGKVYVQAGAGIVADSVPENEYHETMNKAKAMLEAVRLGDNTR